MEGEISGKQIAVIGNEEVLTAFRLGGIGLFYGEEEPNLDFKAILSDKSIGILFLTETFADQNRKVIERHRISDSRTPVVVEIPGTSGQISDRENPIDRLVRKAVGTDQF